MWLCVVTGASVPRGGVAALHQQPNLVGHVCVIEYVLQLRAQDRGGMVPSIKLRTQLKCDTKGCALL